jgi:hypothetical protein
MGNNNDNNNMAAEPGKTKAKNDDRKKINRKMRNMTRTVSPKAISL